MVLLRYLILTLFACSFVVGCDGGSNVRFIVPSGFRGVFKLKIAASVGIVPKDMHGFYVYRIPPSGVLEVSENDARRLGVIEGMVAEFENGNFIPTPALSDPRAQSSTNGVGLYAVSVDTEGSLFFLIGTKLDLHELYKNRDYSLGKILARDDKMPD